MRHRPCSGQTKSQPQDDRHKEKAFPLDRKGAARGTGAVGTESRRAAAVYHFPGRGNSRRSSGQRDASSARWMFFDPATPACGDCRRGNGRLGLLRGLGLLPVASGRRCNAAMAVPLQISAPLAATAAPDASEPGLGSKTVG